MEKKFFYGWWIVAACFFLAFYVGGIIFFGFTAFFDPLRKEFGWSYAQISFAASLRGLEMGIFAPVIGILVDRFGSRILIFCGTIAVVAVVTHAMPYLSTAGFSRTTAGLIWRMRL